MSLRRLLTLAAFAGAALAPSASAATCAGADTQITSATLDGAESAVLCLVNAERAVRGLPPVAQDDELALAAQRHTDDMVARDFFDHSAPAPAPFGVDPGARITAAGYEWSSYGENIAAGYRTPRSVMEGWMASEGHCHNVLEPGFTQLGVGAAVPAATIDRGIGTWTQDFGRSRGVAAPSSDRAPQQGCPYDGLQGVDADGTVLATVPDVPGADAGGSGSSTPAGETPAPSDSVNVPLVTTQTDPARLLVRLRHVGRRLTITGALAAPDRTRVRVLVRQHGRTVWHGAARLRGGRFALRLRTPRRAQRFTVTVSVRGQRVTRSVR